MKPSSRGEGGEPAAAHLSSGGKKCSMRGTWNGVQMSNSEPLSRPMKPGSRGEAGEPAAAHLSSGGEAGELGLPYKKATPLQLQLAPPASSHRFAAAASSHRFAAAAASSHRFAAARSKMDPVTVTDLECVHDAVKHKQIRTGLVGTADGLATLVHIAPRDVLKGADLASLSKTVRPEILEGFPELSDKAYRQLKRDITLENNKVEEAEQQNEVREETPVFDNAAGQENS